MTHLNDSICEILKHFPNFFWWPHFPILTLSPAIGSKIRTKALSCQTPAVFMENLIIQFLLSSSLLVDGSWLGPSIWPSPQHCQGPTGWESSGNQGGSGVGVLLNTAGHPLGGSGVGTGGDRPLEHPPPTHTLTHAQSWGEVRKKLQKYLEKSLQNQFTISFLFGHFHSPTVEDKHPGKTFLLLC